MTIIIDAGLDLVRYDLCKETPATWNAEQHSFCTEYSNIDKEKNKNKGGFYFLFDNEQTCQTVAKIACSNKQQQQYWLTTTKINNQVKIIDFSGCKCIHDVLEIIDVLNLDVYNNSMKLNGLKNGDLTRSFLELKYHNRSTRIFNQYPELIEVSWFGQLLTDFDNGTYFKKMLIDCKIDGYRWCENYNPYGLTYCLLDAEKLDAPKKKMINLDNS